MSRNKLYFFLLSFSLTGGMWILLNELNIYTPEVCLFRRITGIPCPSCGITHSILSIIHGNINQALHANMLGFLLVVVIFVVPAWIVTDLISGKSSFHLFYFKSESFIRKKWISFSAIGILLVNWVLIIINSA
jgi:hypothetical protein